MDFSFFNEPTLTAFAYLCYLLAFLFYAGFLVSRSARALRVPKGQVALAGAGAGASVGGSIEVDMPGEADGRPRVSYAPVIGRVATGLVVAAWVALTTGLILRWIESGHAPYVTLYEIASMLVWGTTTIYLVLFELILKTRAAGVFV